MEPLENKLNAALKTALKALEFYGNGETYFAIGFFPDRPCGDFVKDFSKVNDPYRGENVDRPGKRARKAIDKIAKILND